MNERQSESVTRSSSILGSLVTSIFGYTSFIPNRLLHGVRSPVRLSDSWRLRSSICVSYSGRLRPNRVLSRTKGPPISITYDRDVFLLYIRPKFHESVRPVDHDWSKLDTGKKDSTGPIRRSVPRRFVRGDGWGVRRMRVDSPRSEYCCFLTTSVRILRWHPYRSRPHTPTQSVDSDHSVVTNDFVISRHWRQPISRSRDSGTSRGGEGEVDNGTGGRESKVLNEKW